MKQKIFLLVILLMGIFSSCNNNPSMNTVSGKSDSTTAFGDSIPISNGLSGKVFLLSTTTTKLPDFDTMRPLPDPIFLKQIDIPIQNWSAGFPGLRDRFEWFGIEYTGFFKPIKPGNYLFKLISDDGSQLFIDDSLFINNDGLHAEYPVKGNIYLSDSLHSIKLRYFQGPRYQLGLQLFWSPAEVDSLKIFPGNGFMLRAPKPLFRWWIWLLTGLGIIILVSVIIYKKNKKAKK